MKCVATIQTLFVAMLSVVLAGDSVQTLGFDLTVANMNRLNEQAPLQPQQGELRGGICTTYAQAPCVHS